MPINKHDNRFYCLRWTPRLLKYLNAKMQFELVFSIIAFDSQLQQYLNINSRISIYGHKCKGNRKNY
jgi:hypothetical protein